MPAPQAGNPMSPQCRGPIGDAGSWFHAPGGGWADAGRRNAPTPSTTAAAPPVLSSSRRVSTATMRLLSESRAVKRQDRAGPALLTGGGRPRLLRQIHERISADV